MNNKELKSIIRSKAFAHLHAMNGIDHIPLGVTAYFLNNMSSHITVEISLYSLYSYKEK